MTDTAPSATDLDQSKHTQTGPARSGLDEIAAYRQAMKDKEDRLAGKLNHRQSRFISSFIRS